jgi:hypothetical protein
VFPGEPPHRQAGRAGRRRAGDAAAAGREHPARRVGADPKGRRHYLTTKSAYRDAAGRVLGVIGVARGCDGAGRAQRGAATGQGRSRGRGGAAATGGGGGGVRHVRRRPGHRRGLLVAEDACDPRRRAGGGRDAIRAVDAAVRSPRRLRPRRRADARQPRARRAQRRRGRAPHRAPRRRGALGAPARPHDLRARRPTAATTPRGGRRG